MIDITKRQAKYLDELLLSMLSTPKSRIGSINIQDAANMTKSLNGKSLEYLKALVYPVRIAQINNLVPTLIEGDTTYMIHVQAIKDFLSNGGFVKLRKQHRKSWAERHPVIILLIGAILGLIAGYILELLKVYQWLGLKKD